MKQALCLCLLLLAAVAFTAQAEEPCSSVFSNGYAVTRCRVDTNTSDTHHHKEPVVIVDRADGVDRITAAWISFPPSLDSSSVRIQVSTTTDLADWPQPVPLAAPLSYGGGTTGDPFFALNPRNHEVYLVGVGGNRNEIRLWRSRDFGDSLCEGPCNDEPDDDASDPEPGTQVCYMSGADKPSVAVSPSGEMIYIAHSAGANVIHIHRWSTSDRQWNVIALASNYFNMHSPIVIVNKLSGALNDTISVVFEDYTSSTNRILVWSRLDNDPAIWRSTSYENPSPCYSPLGEDSYPPGCVGSSGFRSKDIGRLLLDDNNLDAMVITGATGTLKIPSMLMARYNASTGKIGIVWHERETGAPYAEVRFVEFDPATGSFQDLKPPPPAGVVTSGNQFHPAIESNPDGSYMVSYYDAPKDSVNYDLKVDHYTAAGVKTISIPNSSSTPAGYGTEIGEYQDIRFSPESGSWYAAFIRVTGTCSDNPVASQCNGDTYVAKITPPCFIDVSPTSVQVPASGATVHFDVTISPEGCTRWTPASNADWAVIDSLASRDASGSFNVTVQPNYGGQRQATIAVAGQSITITQLADPLAETCASQYKPFTLRAGRCAQLACGHETWVPPNTPFTLKAVLDFGDSSVADMRCFKCAWTPSAGQPIEGCPSMSFTASDPMSVTLKVTSRNNMHSDSIKLDIKPNPTVSALCTKRRAVRSSGNNNGSSSCGPSSSSTLIQLGESVTLYPPEGVSGSSYDYDWHKADPNNLDVLFSDGETVNVSPTVDTKYWIVYRYTDSSGVAHEETSENHYVLIQRSGNSTVQITPRFQVIPAGAGGVIEVTDSAANDNYDGYTFEWNVGNDNTRPSTPLPWPYRRLVFDMPYDTSFWCRVTDPHNNVTTTDVATVAVTCSDGLRGSIGVSPGNYVSRTGRPVVTAEARGLRLRYDWFERLPEETTPRPYSANGAAISPTLARPLTYYSAKIQDACGQTAVLPETPVYLCLPTIDSQPVDQVVPRGGSTSLTVAASPAIAGQPLTMTWRSTETGQVVGSGPTLSFTPAPGTTQTFYADVSADCSGTPRSVQTRTATVTGCELAATAYSDRNIALGQTATLTASISGAQAQSDAEYTWYYGLAPGTEYVSGVGLSSITTAPQTTTTYWVRVKDGTCTADSNPVTVRICVPTITSQPQGTLIRAGQTASLSVGVAPLNNETLSYQWYVGAKGNVTQPVSGATSSTFTTPALSATTSYWVRVTSSCGAMMDSAAAVVTVCNNPVISSVTPTRYIRSGGSATHQVSATGNSLTYQWYIGSPGNTSAPISGATLSSISKSPTTTTTYWARVASYGLCTTDSAAMVIDVCTDPPIATQPASKTINSGQSATLTVGTSAAGTTYQWYLGTGAAIQGATSSSLTVTPATDTQYFAQVARGACTSTSNTATVTVCSLATSLSGGTNIALGQSATLNATESGSRSQPTNYEWYAGTGASSYIIASGSGLWQKTVTPSITTQYWVRISDGTCTVDSSPVTVSVCKPTITAQPQGTTVNSGQTATLSVTATGAPLSYQWYIGAAGNTAQPIAGATSATYTTPAMSATMSYWVRVTGCTTADSVAATVNVCAPPAITSGPTASTQRIPGTTGYMTVTASGTGLTYQWFTGQSGDTTVPVAGPGCNSSNCSFTLSSSKYYWVRLIGTCGTLNSPAVIHPVSPNIYQQPQSASVPPSATPTLSVGVSGTSLTYQWYRGTIGNTTTPMSGATAATFTVPPVTEPVSYWCRVTSVGNSTAIADSTEATLSFCTGPAVYGPVTQYLGYNQWRLGINVEEQDLGNVDCAWYTGVPGNISQSVFQYEGGTYTNVTATSTQTWWCRAWYSDHSCYTDTGGATIYKVQ